MLASLALCLAARQAAIAYETKAARLPVILEELQSKTGLKLTCDGVFESEVMLISVTDVEPGKLLDKIAVASVGEWEKKGNGLYLRPDMKRRATEEKERIARRVSRIQEILDRCKKELEAPYKGESPSPRVPGQPTNEASHAKERNLPFPRCAMRLLISIGAERLAQVPLAGRTVFAISPNANQVALPEGSERVIEQFRQEWELAEKSGSRQIGGGFTISGEGHVISSRHQFNRIWFSVADLLSYTSFYPTAYLGMADQHGYGVSGGLDVRPFTPYVNPKSVVETADTPLTYDPQTLAFRAARQANIIRGRTGIDPGSILAKAIAADSFEPLSLGSELILQYAKMQGADLVALIPDSAFHDLTSWDKPTTNAVEETLNRLFKRESEDDWQIVSPARPADARRLRDRRKEVRLLLKDAIDGHVSLDQESEYLLARPIDAPVGLGLQMAQLLDGELPGQYPREELRAKRIYGLLPREARRPGKSGFRDLSAEVRAELSRSVFEDGALEYRPDSQPLVRSPFDVYSISMNRKESTLYWPEGIPSDAVFDVSVADVLSVRTSNSKQANSHFGESITTAGYARYWQGVSRATTDPNDVSRQIDRYQPLEEKEFIFTIRHDIWAKALWAHDRRTVGAPVPYDQLPVEYKDAIQKEADKIKASRGTKPPSAGLQRGSPPPG